MDSYHACVRTVLSCVSIGARDDDTIAESECGKGPARVVCDKNDGMIIISPHPYKDAAKDGLSVCIHGCV